MFTLLLEYCVGLCPNNIYTMQRRASLAHHAAGVYRALAVFGIPGFSVGLENQGCMFILFSYINSKYNILSIWAEILGCFETALANTRMMCQ